MSMKITSICISDYMENYGPLISENFMASCNHWLKQTTPVDVC